MCSNSIFYLVILLVFSTYFSISLICWRPDILVGALDGCRSFGSKISSWSSFGWRFLKNQVKLKKIKRIVTSTAT